MNRLQAAITATLAGLAAACSTTPDTPAVPEPRYLFDGETLEGWHPIGGDMRFAVEDGAIVGYAKRQTPSTYLSTRETFSDFIFEAEMTVVGFMNSGIQFRTREIDAPYGSTVQGFQMEYDPSPRNWSGGIYGQSFGEFRYVTNANTACRESFRHGAWNTYRIEAIGPEIATFINGHPCSRYYGEERREGFFSLQMHSVGGAGVEDMRGKWRNILVWTGRLEALRTPLPDSVVEQNYVPNTLSDWEQRVGYGLVWDGDRLRLFDGAYSPADDGFALPERGQPVVSEVPYGSFELLFDFKLEPGASGAVRYLADPAGQGGAAFRLADSGGRVDDPSPETVGALQGRIAPRNMLEAGNGRHIRSFKAGVWNRARIVVRGNSVEHWLNHTKVVEYDRCANDLAAPAGHIALHDETGGIEFRSVKLRRLDEAPETACAGS